MATARFNERIEVMALFQMDFFSKGEGSEAEKVGHPVSNLATDWFPFGFHLREVPAGRI